jgi:hypothetical protein
MKINENNSSDNNFPYSLHNLNNYKKHLYSINENSNNDTITGKINEKINDILNKYVLLIIDYMRLISEKIYIKKISYYKFIFIRGLDTITSVFKLLLFFTKNIDVTYYHSQKAFYFYIEFIEQISSDQNTFLNLSSRDACMFVYKKTVFEINNDVKKNIKDDNPEEKKIFSLIDNHTTIYKNIIYFCIQHEDFDYVNKMTYINKFCDDFKHFSYHLNEILFTISNDKLQFIYVFINILSESKITIEVFFEILGLFISKIMDKKVIVEDVEIKNKLSSNDFIYKIQNAKTFISWIFQ